MITKCPTCATLFRVTPQQLQAHGGKVRCGQCMSVFDGLKALAAPPPPTPEPAGTGEPAGFELEPVEAAAASAAAGPSPAPREPETVFEEKDYGPPPEQLSFDDQLYDEAGRRDSRWWALGAALLLLALGGQAGYFHRGELAARFPGLKPHLVQLCTLADCRVLPPQRPKQIAIEASDLQAPDPARPRLIRLTATLRNHAAQDLGYPALDLVLTNTKEHTLARRIFLPAEYLGRGRDIEAGIPASAEITVRLDIDTGDLNPAGFRLDLLAAPPP